MARPYTMSERAKAARAANGAQRTAAANSVPVLTKRLISLHPEWPPERWAAHFDLFGAGSDES